jgi:1,2-dihydroxy-3-keto-5-methylthiopentene dioxygenase
MATLRIPTEDRTLDDETEVTEYLARCGIDYQQWKPAHETAANAPAEEILQAYADEIQELKAQGGYVTADVIDVNPQTPGLDAMLSKFNREHWHNEDEVRFIIAGHGLFHIHPKDAPVVAVEVEAGDLIRVPRETRHWFDLCADRQIRAIRLFQDAAGWTPYYTESGIDQEFQPVCFGASYFPVTAGAV